MTVVTLKIKLSLTNEQSRLLDQTIEQFTGSFNRVCCIAWDAKRVNGVELHHASYEKERDQTDLPSQLVVSARMKATEAVKSAKSRINKKRKASMPQSKRCPIRYDARSATIKLSDGQASLASIQGRQKLSFVLPEYYHSKKDWKVCSSDLCKDKHGKYFLHVVVENKDPEYIASGRVIGVDLGVNRPAVTSDNKFFGKKRWKEIENRYFRLKRALQAKGTKSAKRHLRVLSRKVNRFRNDCDHVISKKIVNSVLTGDLVVLEDLTNIRERVKVRKKTRRRIHAWSFSRLQSYLDYKSRQVGVRVEYIDPRYTSQKCSKCYHIERANRKTQSVFKCKKCGFTHNADLNAAKTIRINHLASFGINAFSSETSGLPVNQPIVSSLSDLGISSFL